MVFQGTQHGEEVANLDINKHESRSRTEILALVVSDHGLEDTVKTSINQYVIVPEALIKQTDRSEVGQ